MNKPIHPTEQLIIFTRYPQPGTTKTRLIPALGAEGAALLQRQMTEHTLAQAIALRPPTHITLCFTGGDRSLMETWLGSTVNYQPQSTGDLGDRMATAFRTAFNQGRSPVVTIGIDCPELNTVRLKRAFTLLQSHDVVLGPATDGGYYLIGLSQFHPELFQGIAWGSDRVLQQTVDMIEALGLSLAYLDPLADIDRPGDLAIWERAKPQSQGNPQRPSHEDKISVIIPTLNEAAQMTQCLAQLQGRDGIEIIVVDGGSHDETRSLAQSLGANVLTTLPGRAQQMNAGAAVATGAILLFLHADTRLPQGFDQEARQLLAQPNVAAGAFQLKIDGPQWGLRWIEWGVYWRSRLWQMPYGDQALFLKSRLFHELGGFASLPIMEDFELVQRLQRQGQVAIAPGQVFTSARRWQTLGVLRTTVINQLLVLGYRCGISPTTLSQWYRGRATRMVQTPLEPDSNSQFGNGA